jgi:hypothetical protein
MQSKAADISSRLRSVIFLSSSAAISMSDQTRSKTVSVEWPFLYAPTGNAATEIQLIAKWCFRWSL